MQNTTETMLEIDPTQRARYVYGNELIAAQEQNRISVSPHRPYIYAKFISETLDDIEHQKSKLQEFGNLEEYGTIRTGYAELIVQEQLHIDKWTQEAAKDLATRQPQEVSNLNTDDPKGLQTMLAEHYKQFRAEVEEREPELLLAKQQFAQRLHETIDQQGLPLTHEQLDARLANVTVGFRDPLSVEKGQLGGYDYGANRVTVSPSQHGHDLLRTVYHELLHAVSSQRIIKDADPNTYSGITIRRLGLEHPKRDRLWLNEAVTDLLADMLVDKETKGFDFGSDKYPLVHGGRYGVKHSMHKVTLRSMKAGYYIYNDYKFAANDATKGIPMETLLKAYFAQDNDAFETDQRAGTHAERELTRALKSAAGINAVRKLRLVGQAFQEDEPKKAQKHARQLGRKSVSLIPGVGELRKARNSRNARKHSERYKEQIDRAKRHLA